MIAWTIQKCQFLIFWGEFLFPLEMLCEVLRVYLQNKILISFVHLLFSQKHFYYLFTYVLTLYFSFPAGTGPFTAMFQNLSQGATQFTCTAQGEN